MKTPDTTHLPPVDPEHFEDFEGFRETFMAKFTEPAHVLVLRGLSGMLEALIDEVAGVMPQPPEGWYRTCVRAILGDLRFIQGYLTDLGDSRTVVPRGAEHLARLATIESVSVGKIADAFEAALAREDEESGGRA